METKTQKFKRLFKEQKYKEALRVIKSFKKGFTTDELRCLNIAWECISGNESFYHKLGIDVDKIKYDAYNIMLDYAHPELKNVI